MHRRDGSGPLVWQWLRSARAWSGAFGILVGFQGVWSYVAPRSFFDMVATFEPYNEHFMRDGAAMEIGFAVVMIVGAFQVRAVVVGLSGLVVFEALHTISHLLDRNDGGRPGFDIPALSLVTLASALALWLAIQRETTDQPATKGAA